ncbi:hypothetical protein Sm713_41130 [Streptomyces sp. TS71-3]|nr:hypothetical protein Sm713_41130 [Streptomyces sp. TS71-3]
MVVFAANEWVARSIRIGRAIGSAALVAGGCTHAPMVSPRWPSSSTTAWTELGWRPADPVIGLLITAMILSMLHDPAREVLRRVWTRWPRISSDRPRPR